MKHFGLSLAPNADGVYDLHLAGNGALAVVADAEAVGQHVRQRLKTYRGEWFLDTRAGPPWLSDILGDSYDPALAEAVIKAEILGTQGVTGISSFSVRFNRERRELEAFEITVETVYGIEVTV